MKQVYRQLCNLFRGKLHTMSALSVAVLVMLCLQVAGASASSLHQNAYPDVIVTYYACVNNTTGAITIVNMRIRIATITITPQFDDIACADRPPFTHTCLLKAGTIAPPKDPIGEIIVS